jgi:methionine synthase II (cobalamin-independent)
MRITAAGSLPGDDFRGALTAMTEALPELTPFPELPDRGVGADMIGRALGLVDGLAFDLQPAGWRLTGHSDADHRRAQALWRRDLDDAEELLQGFEGRLKVAVAGPWTLASSVERPAGDRLLADHGARRELAQALLEGVGALQSQLSRRLPGVEVVWQLDEPSLVAVRDAQVPTASGFSKHRRVSEAELSDALKPFSDAILHCCAGGDWLGVADRAGFTHAYVDARLVHVDVVGEWLDKGRELVLGVVDTASRRVQGVDRIVDNTRRITREVGISDAMMLAPACGFAGWSVGDAARQLDQLRRAADLVSQDRG